jgi:hypothetical protein
VSVERAARLLAGHHRVDPAARVLARVVVGKARREHRDERGGDGDEGDAGEHDARER